MRDGAPPGDLIYCSLRKLWNLAVYFGLQTGAPAPGILLEHEAGVSAGIPSLGEISARRKTRRERTDPATSERATAQLLDRVLSELARGGLPDIEAADSEPMEGGWFRFHRRVRFGVGHADSIDSVRALLVVDETHVPDGLSTPGLLLTGAIAHVLPPYASEEMREAPGSRSGSGTDHLFVWLDRAREALEADPGADLDAIDASPFRAGHPPRDAKVAHDMYGLFTEAGWHELPVVPRLLRGAPCEGVAQASFIAVDGETTLLMGSPLYIRVRALPSTPGSRASFTRGGHRLLRRFFGLR